MYASSGLIVSSYFGVVGCFVLDMVAKSEIGNYYDRVRRLVDRRVFNETTERLEMQLEW